MKISGKTLTKLNEIVLVFERNGIDEEGNEREDIVFRMQPVEDYEDFLKLCPEPEPPLKIIKGGARVKNTEDPAYIKLTHEWLSRQINFTTIVSMMGTPNLEFEKVDLAKPSTWHLIVEELQEVLYPGEILAVYEASSNVNNVTDASLEKARKRFLAGERQRATSQSSQTAEPESTPSGEPAKDSESGPQA
jgi:hypothetical protein